MKRKITRVLPPDIKQGIRKLFSLVPIRYRLGTRFWQIKNFIENAEKWDSETIKKWQTQKLKETVTNVYAHVPGYYLLYKDAGVKPEDIQSLDDIKILPFVTKELIRDNLKDFTSQAISRLRRLYVTTGGSTGIPFGFCLTMLLKELLCIQDGREHSGIWETNQQFYGAVLWEMKIISFLMTLME